MLAQLAQPVALGIAAGLARLVTVAHQEHQQLSSGSARKRERNRASLTPLVVGLGVNRACERILEVAKDETTPVSREPVGPPRADERRHRRATTVRADDKRRLHVVCSSVGATVAHAGAPPRAPAQRLNGTALADVHALLTRCLHQLYIL